MSCWSCSTSLKDQVRVGDAADIAGARAPEPEVVKNASSIPETEDGAADTASARAPQSPDINTASVIPASEISAADTAGARALATQVECTRSKVHES